MPHHTRTTALAAAALLALAACSTDDAEHPPKAPEAAAEKAKKAPADGLAEPGKVGAGTVTLSGFRRGTERQGYDHPIPYLRYKLTFHNTSSTTVDLVNVASVCYHGPKNTGTASIDTDETSPLDTHPVAPGATADEIRACRFPKSAKAATIQVDAVVPGGSSTTFGGRLPR
ncbi:hypothetical protein [Streptomyces qinglanensis]|uniref:hypothetical protein n=1 Tax=Streptomyces qinglanensis TaxID=943816 RepID=UPI003D704853